MAQKKGQGSSRNGRDSHSKRLGVKVGNNQPVRCGNILVRQRGYSKHAGAGVKVGKDYTLYAVTDGVALFSRRKGVSIVSVT